MYFWEHWCGGAAERARQERRHGRDARLPSVTRARPQPADHEPAERRGYRPPPMPATTGTELAQRLRDGDLTAAPAVLNLVETRTPAAREEIAALLRGGAPGAL